MPRADGRELAAIFVGGAIGALARVAVTRLLPAPADAWPWAIFAVNVTGGFLLGVFATRLQERLPLSSYRRPLLGTGFCGGLTTFSTMQLEAFTMIESGRTGLAVAYLVASVGCGLAAVWLATAVVRRVRRL